MLDSAGKPLMPTKASRVRKWIKEGKAKVIKTKLGLFAVQLLIEPKSEAPQNQEIAIGIDPGSSYTGVAVVSKRVVLCGFNLELPTYITDRMSKRAELRRSRRYRNKRRRKCRFLNRCNKHKIAPSVKARKQLELRVVRGLANIFPVSIIAIEDVAYNHRRSSKGKLFSQIEIGKKWLVQQLSELAEVRLIRGWETSVRRKELGLNKIVDKAARVIEAHVTDSITLCALVTELSKELKFKLAWGSKRTAISFDVIRRPKYSRRKLHLEQPSKGGVRRQYGGTTTPFVYRKGDYVEASQGKRTVRGWVSGYTKNSISVSDFNWKRLGQFVVKKVRLLERNSGLLLKSKEVKEVEFLPRLKPWVSFA